MEYDMDTNGGLMPQILALTAPPGSRDRTDNGDASSNLSAHPYFKRPGRGHNRDCCDSCGEGGDLICCDICPASFHLVCHDPPLDEETIPQGEWGCHQCRANDVLGTAPTTSSNKFSNKSAKRKEREEDKGSKAMSLSSKMSRLECSKSKLIVSGRPVEADKSVFAPLIIDAASRNPKEFCLPYSMTVPIAFPGESKNTHRNGKRIVNSRKKRCDLDSGGMVPLPARLCYTCNRSCRAGPLLACDYCSLLFHLDCLDPPLTTAPSGRWLCPNHPQHYMEDKVLLTASVSDRVKLWEKCTGPVDEVNILRTLLNKIHRPRPLVRHRTKLSLRDRIKVPAAIKHAYSNPSTVLPALPPPHLRPPTTTFTSSSLHPKLHFTKSVKVVDKSESEDTSSNSTRSSSLENEHRTSPLEHSGETAETKGTAKSKEESTAKSKEETVAKSAAKTSKSSKKLSDSNKGVKRKDSMRDMESVDSYETDRPRLGGINVMAAAAMAILAQEKRREEEEAQKLLSSERKDDETTKVASNAHSEINSIIEVKEEIFPPEEESEIERQSFVATIKKTEKEEIIEENMTSLPSLENESDAQLENDLMATETIPDEEEETAEMIKKDETKQCARSESKMCSVNKCEENGQRDIMTNGVMHSDEERTFDNNNEVISDDKVSFKSKLDNCLVSEYNGDESMKCVDSDWTSPIMDISDDPTPLPNNYNYFYKPTSNDVLMIPNYSSQTCDSVTVNNSYSKSSINAPKKSMNSFKSITPFVDSQSCHISNLINGIDRHTLQVTEDSSCQPVPDSTNTQQCSNDLKATEEEAAEWLSGLISFQASAAKYLIQKNVKIEESEPSNDIEDLPPQEEFKDSSPAVSVRSSSPLDPHPPQPLPAATPVVTKPSARSGRKQVLIPRMSPTGSSSQPHETKQTPAAVKTQLTHPAAAKCASLSELLSESLTSLQSKLHSSLSTQWGDMMPADKTLLEVLAMQRLSQLLPQKETKEKEPVYTTPPQPAHAILCPLNEPPSPLQDWLSSQSDSCPQNKSAAINPVPMTNRVLTVGASSDNDVNLTLFGHCNYVSANHAAILQDNYTGFYELVTYSQHGSVVDGVHFTCDANKSEVPSLSCGTSTTNQQTTTVQQVREMVQKHKHSYLVHGKDGNYDFRLKPQDRTYLANKVRPHPSTCKASQPGVSVYKCHCDRKTPGGQGWEGPAVIRHGSYIKFGCLKFVFSIVETASKGNWYTTTEEAYKKFYEKEKKEESKFKEELEKIRKPVSAKSNNATSKGSSTVSTKGNNKSNSASTGTKSNSASTSSKSNTTSTKSNSASTISKSNTASSKGNSSKKSTSKDTEMKSEKEPIASKKSKKR